MNIDGFAAQHCAIIGGDTNLRAYCLDLIHALHRECRCNGEKHAIECIEEKVVHSEGSALEAAARFAVRKYHNCGRVYVCVVAPSKQAKRKAGCDGPPLAFGAVAYDS